MPGVAVTATLVPRDYYNRSVSCPLFVGDQSFRVRGALLPDSSASCALLVDRLCTFAPNTTSCSASIALNGTVGDNCTLHIELGQSRVDVLAQQDLSVRLVDCGAGFGRDTNTGQCARCALQTYNLAPNGVCLPCPRGALCKSVSLR